MKQKDLLAAEHPVAETVAAQALGAIVAAATLVGILAVVMPEEILEIVRALLAGILPM